MNTQLGLKGHPSPKSHKDKEEVEDAFTILHSNSRS